MAVLTINAGSSSIRFAFYGPGLPLAKLSDGKIERIGLPDTSLTVHEPHGKVARRVPLDASDFRAAVGAFAKWLESQPLFADVTAVGHRVVHGLKRTHPERVTTELVADLRAITPYDPEHMPQELALIEAVSAKFPHLPQVACFDTAFHRTMPRVATLLPIPRCYESKGLQRYGFHGLSYTYLLQELERRGDPAATRGRVVFAHLGSGASLAAVRDGQSVDTSMGFTPTGGFPMSTRSGDLDPGGLNYLARTESMDTAALEQMVNHRSGLVGISEISPDVRDLLARENDDVRAAEAVAVFCYQVKKWVAAFAGALGGLDTLVFAGGIGENSAPIRARICEGLQFLGLELNEARNRQNAPLISHDARPVTVRVIPTDEESVIARMTLEALEAHHRGNA